MKRLLGITMGCPVGIGPEIILRFFATGWSLPGYAPVVLGDIGVLRHTAAMLGLPGELVAWQPGMAVGSDTIPVYSLSDLPQQELVWGRPDAMTGKAMASYVEAAVRLTMQGVLAGIVTCPISKKALQLAGYSYPGHTEMLAELSGGHRYLMMMVGSRLRVVLATIHEPLRRVSELLTRERVSECLRITAAALRSDFGVARPRIAVAALNPHGGEQGMFGSEEEEIIGPAIHSCAVEGEVSGPWPPDTVFYRAATGDFDAVVAMYHDQGLIPFKLLHFKDGVNVTLGLPLVRTSVDHGTAYDIAGQGRADCASLAAAASLAAEIVDHRTQRGR